MKCPQNVAMRASAPLRPPPRVRPRLSVRPPSPASPLRPHAPLAIYSCAPIPHLDLPPFATHQHPHGGCSVLAAEVARSPPRSASYPAITPTLTLRPDSHGTNSRHPPASPISPGRGVFPCGITAAVRDCRHASRAATPSPRYSSPATRGETPTRMWNRRRRRRSSAPPRDPSRTPGPRPAPPPPPPLTPTPCRRRRRGSRVPSSTWSQGTPRLSSSIQGVPRLLSLSSRAHIRAPAGRMRRSAARHAACQSQDGQIECLALDGATPTQRRDLLPSQLHPSTQHHGLAPLAVTGDAYQSFLSLVHARFCEAAATLGPHHRSDGHPISQRR